MQNSGYDRCVIQSPMRRNVSGIHRDRCYKICDKMGGASKRGGWNKIIIWRECERKNEILHGRGMRETGTG